MVNKPNFATTWVFAAIYIKACDKVELWELIGNSDLLNHAIPTSNEIAESLLFLEAHNLAHVEGDIIKTTRNGSEIFKKVKVMKGGLFEVPNNVLKIFNKKLNYDIGVPEKEDYSINEESVNQAYNEYIMKMKSS